jgi:hypothetical protein
MPQFRARSAGLQPGISPNADLKVGTTSAVAPETEALPLNKTKTLIAWPIFMYTEFFGDERQGVQFDPEGQIKGCMLLLLYVR